MEGEIPFVKSGCSDCYAVLLQTPSDHLVGIFVRLLVFPRVWILDFKRQSAGEDEQLNNILNLTYPTEMF